MININNNNNVHILMIKKIKQEKTEIHGTVTLDSRALFIFTEGATIGALRESRVEIATLKNTVVQNHFFKKKRKS